MTSIILLVLGIVATYFMVIISQLTRICLHISAGQKQQGQTKHGPLNIHD